MENELTFEELEDGKEMTLDKLARITVRGFMRMEKRFDKVGMHLDH